MRILRRSEMAHCELPYYALIISLPLANSTFFERSDLRYVIPFMVMALIIYQYVRREKIHTTIDRWISIVDAPTIFLLLFFLWGSATLWFGLRPVRSLLYAVGSLPVFIVGYVIVRFKGCRSFRLQFLKMLGIMGLLFAGLGLILWLVGSPAALHSRPSHFGIIIRGSISIDYVPVLKSIFNHPNFLGLISFLGLSSTALLIEHSKGRRAIVFYVIAIIILLVALCLSFSRSSILAAFVALLTFSILYRGRRNYLSLPVLLLLGAYLMAQMVTKDLIFLPEEAMMETSDDTLEEVEMWKDTKEAKTTPSGRLILWDASLSWIREEPIVGAGFGNSALAISRFIPIRYQRFQGLTPHNTYLRILVENGYPGFLLYLGFMLIVLIKPLRSMMARRQIMKDPTYVGLYALQIGGLVIMLLRTTFPFGVGIGSFFLLVIAALLLAAPES